MFSMEFQPRVILSVYSNPNIVIVNTDSIIIVYNRKKEDSRYIDSLINDFHSGDEVLYDFEKRRFSKR